MSLSTIIAKVILKILEAFGIKPQTKGKAESFTKAETKESKLDLKPLKPLAEAQTNGSLINHALRPLDDAHFGRLSTAGDVATEPAPILPPEATDPTDAPDWLDDKYGDDWKTHVNK